MAVAYIKHILLVRFGWKNTGQCLVEDLLQLVSTTYGVGLGFLTSFLKTHDLLNIHSQVRDGVTTGFLNVPDFRDVRCPVFPVWLLLLFLLLVLVRSGQ